MIRLLVLWTNRLMMISAPFICSLAWPETIDSGRVEFIAETSVKMFRFKGETKNFQSRLERTGNHLISLEVRIPTESLKTGMEIRDKHMRERIFTSKDGLIPDIVFKAGPSDCLSPERTPTDSSKEQLCEINGSLSFRGQQHPIKLAMTLKDGFTVEGKALVDVLDFGVSPDVLKWTGVIVDHKVWVNFEAKIKDKK